MRKQLKFILPLGALVLGFFFAWMSSSANVAEAGRGCRNHCDLTPPPPAGDPGPVEQDGTCPHTIGYWKNHANKWEAAAGFGPNDIYPFLADGENMTYLEILWSASASDMTRMLAAQLVGSQLSVASGAGLSIQPVIDDALAFLADHPVGSDPQGANRDYAESLKDQLDDYNNTNNNCDDLIVDPPNPDPTPSPTPISIG